ncbi:MAG: hypothetical protein IIT53_04230 [Fibrobacter sp.]|nr:hypothetical protein [Fibrobacter sp.]
MKKLLSLLVASSFAFYMQACSDATSADDDEIDLVSSSSDGDASSSSKAKSSSSKKVKSSSSKKTSSSSVKAKSSSSKKVSSSSAKAKSSSSKKVSSSSVKAKSSSSVAKSSSSVAKSSSSVAKSSSSVVISSSSEEVVTTYVFGSDYTTGELRWIVDGKISAKSIQLNQDSKVISAGENIFVLERYGADNIVLIDQKGQKIKWQQSFETNDNPSDVVKASDTEVWVGLEGPNKIVKVAVADGKVTKTIKTDDFAKAEGQFANVVDLEVSGDTLFALFRRAVAGWPAGYPDPGLLAMYKLNDGTLLDTIRLAKVNPSAMAFVNGKLYVASAGQYEASGATLADDVRGIEVVDFAKKASTTVVDGTKLGGGISSFAVDAKNGIAYAAIYKNYGDVPLVQVDLSAKTVTSIAGVSDVEGSLAFDAATSSLYIGDRVYGSEAVYVYKAGKVSKLEAADGVLPPYSITIMK